MRKRWVSFQYTLMTKTTVKPPRQVVHRHPVSENAWTTPKTREAVMCGLAFYPGVTSLWIIPPDAVGAYFSYMAFWIVDSPINRATVIVRLYKCKHRCSSPKKTKPHPCLFAFWAKQFLIRICWFIFFKTPSILLLLPVTQGDYMMARSPWKQWTNLRCFHCCR